jgi:hypothetical protein
MTVKEPLAASGQPSLATVGEHKTLSVFQKAGAWVDKNEKIIKVALASIALIASIALTAAAITIAFAPTIIGLPLTCPSIAMLIIFSSCIAFSLGIPGALISSDYLYKQYKGHSFIDAIMYEMFTSHECHQRNPDVQYGRVRFAKFTPLDEIDWGDPADKPGSCGYAKGVQDRSPAKEELDRE